MYTKTGWAIRAQETAEGWRLEAFNKNKPSLLVIWCTSPGEILYWSQYPNFGELEAFQNYLDKIF